MWQGGSVYSAAAPRGRCWPLKRSGKSAARGGGGGSPQVLSVFNCTEIHNKRYLVVDMRLDCDSLEHQGFLGVASLGVLIFPFGIPALFIALLLHYKVGHLRTPRGILGPLNR